MAWLPHLQRGPACDTFARCCPQWGVVDPVSHIGRTSGLEVLIDAAFRARPAFLQFARFKPMLGNKWSEYLYVGILVTWCQSKAFSKLKGFRAKPSTNPLLWHVNIYSLYVIT